MTASITSCCWPSVIWANMGSVTVRSPYASVSGELAMVAGVHREAVDRGIVNARLEPPFREPAAEVVAVDILFEHDREQMMRGRVAGEGR